MKRISWFILSSFLLLSFEIYGQGLFKSATTRPDSLSASAKTTFSGYIKGSVFAPVNSQTLNAAYARASCQSQVHWQSLRSKLEVWVNQGWMLGEKPAAFQLRECWLGIEKKSYSIRAGNQIIRWGTGEGFNPTQNTSPTDPFSLSGETNDAYLPNFMIDAQYHFSPQTHLEGIWIPVHKASIYRFDLVRQENNVSFRSPETPDPAWHNSSVALKVRHHFPGVTLSLSGFQGYDPLPVLNPAHIYSVNMIPAIEYETKPFRKSSLGGDMEIQAGPLIIRGEMAANRMEKDTTEGWAPETNVSYVTNVETGFRGWTILFQYIGSFVPGFETLTEPEWPSNQDPESLSNYQLDMIRCETVSFNRALFWNEHRWNHALSLHLNKRLFSQQLSVQLDGLYRFYTDEWMCFSTIEWSISDHMSLSLGYRHFQGPDGSLFSYTGPVLTNAFVEWKSSF